MSKKGSKRRERKAVASNKRGEHDGFLAQFDICREQVAKWREAMPGLFDSQGRALVAELRFPEYDKRNAPREG